VTQATLVAQITYAGPSWRGFVKAEETARLKAVLLTACLYLHLYTDFHPLEDLLDSSNESLFRFIRYNPLHVLHQLLPLPLPMHLISARPIQSFMLASLDELHNIFFEITLKDL